MSQVIKANVEQSQYNTFPISCDAYLKISDAIVEFYLQTLALKMSPTQLELKYLVEQK